MTPQARRRPPISTAARHAYQDFFRSKELGRPRSSSIACPSPSASWRRRDHLDPEQTWQLNQWGPDGHASLRMTQRPLVDPDAVRRAEVGEAWVIAAGRSLHLQVAQTPYTA
jgi:hypothetical protein